MLVPVWGTAEILSLFSRCLLTSAVPDFQLGYWLQSKQGPFGTDLSGRGMYRPTSHIGSYSHPRKARSAQGFLLRPPVSCPCPSLRRHRAAGFLCVPLPTRVRVDSFRHWDRCGFGFFGYLNWLMYLPCSVQVNLVLCYKIDATEVRVVVIAGEETDKTRCSERSCCLLEGLRISQLLVS